MMRVVSLTRTKRRTLLGVAMALGIVAAFLCLPGCGDGENVEPAGIANTGQPILAGLLARPLDKDIRVMAYGHDTGTPPRKIPLPGIRIAFALRDQPESARGTAFSSPDVHTNAGGLANTSFIVGDKPGLYHIEASLPDFPDVPPVAVTVLGGVKITGTDQDGRVGKALDGPLTVRLERAPGLPVADGGGQVRFTLMGAPAGTSLSESLGRTDADGVVATDVRLGDSQGTVEVGVTVLEGIPGEPSRLAPMTSRFFSIDVWTVTVTLLGGLALFLFGMRMMSDSLQFVAGDKMRDLLNLLTTNRFMAVGAGATVTALIQSSSACTVMIVGFVNAGLMRLEQAIGVIMGANIGTTITAQIVSLKLTALALPAVFLGVLLLFFAKRQTAKYWASIVIGFGILFLGMNIMSEELGQLKDSESVISLFRGLDCVPGPGGFVPFLAFLKAVLCGLAATLVLQSSSATIGMLIAIASAGLIDPYAAFGILLGDNIGTTVTAVLASLGTGTAARRAAAFHVTFNVCGCILMLALNYVNWPGRPGRPVFMELANMFTPGDVFRDSGNLPRFIANAHTLFNISCTALFISFIPQFARLCRRLVPDAAAGAGGGEDSRRVLEPHLQAMPSLAIQQAWTEVGVMLVKARAALNEGYHALVSDPAQGDDWNSRAREARNLEKETDEIKAAVTRYLSGIVTLNENQSEMFPYLVRTVNDAEKVADLGKHLSKLAGRMNKRSLMLTSEAVEDIRGMKALADDILLLAEKTIAVSADGVDRSGGGAVMLRKLLEEGKLLEKAAKARASELRKRHEARLEEGLCNIRSGMVFLDVANSLGRTAGCALNIIKAACHTPDDIVFLEN